MFFLFLYDIYSSQFCGWRWCESFTFLHLISRLLVGHARIRCHSHRKGLPQQYAKAPDITFCGIVTWKHQQRAANTQTKTRGWQFLKKNFCWQWAKFLVLAAGWTQLSFYHSSGLQEPSTWQGSVWDPPLWSKRRHPPHGTSRSHWSSPRFSPQLGSFWLPGPFWRGKERRQTQTWCDQRLIQNRCTNIVFSLQKRRARAGERPGVPSISLALHVRQLDMQRYRLSSYRQPALIRPCQAKRAL